MMDTNERRLDRIEQRSATLGVSSPSGTAGVSRRCRRACGFSSSRFCTSENGNDTLSDENVAEGRDRRALSVLAYNITRVINIVGVFSLIAAMKA
jgi:hypothetical protein